jgi:Na+/H+-dicarboxylate symporter
MVIGAVGGLVFGERAAVVEPLGDLFIRLLMMAAVPLVFFNLLAGLTGLGNAAELGRLATRTLAYFWITTLIALSLGLVAAALLNPGQGMQLTETVQDNVGAVPNVVDLLLGFVPDNPVAAFAEANVVQVVVFAVLLGLATLALPEGRRAQAANLYALGAELFRKLVDIVLYVAPVGIGALTAVALGVYGDRIFGPLGLFIVGVIGGQLVMFAIYMVLLATLSDRPPGHFLKQTGTVWATTSATCSSLASLAVALDVAERIRMPRSIYGFTLPLGAQINKDGTALFLSMVIAFTAQAAGVEWSAGSVVMVILVGFLLSQGSAGIPGGGFVISLVYVQAFQLPLEIAAIVGGIYRLVDIGNTTFNVMGDMVGTAIIERDESRRKATA